MIEMTDNRTTDLVKRESEGEGESCESNYARRFSTLERAARTMALMCECSHECSFCLLQGRAANICHNGDYDALLEWLRGES